MLRERSRRQKSPRGKDFAADPHYKYFFGELLLCFIFAHEDRKHECVFVEYLWPDDLKFEGTSLVTRYTHMPKRMLAVLSVSAVEFVAPLFTVSPMGVPLPNARTIRVLNDDIYGNF